MAASPPGGGSSAPSDARRGGHHWYSVPVRFASKEDLTADDLRSAAIRSYPRPSVLADPVKGLDALAIATWGDLVEHLPHSHRDRREVRRVAELMVGEEATVAVAVRTTSVKPMRNRRQKRVEARVFDETGPLVAVWFNQPWVARQLGEGAMVLLHGKLRQRNQFWVTEHELIGNGEAPVHTLGLVPVHPATQGVSPARLRQLVSEARSRMLAVVEPCRPGSASRSSSPSGRPRSRRFTFRSARRTNATRGAGSPSRSCSSSSSPWPDAGERGARDGAPAARGARGGGGPLALVAPVRAHGRPAAGDRGDRHRPRRRAADAAPADGRGG